MLAWLPPIAWLGVIAFFTLTPNPLPPELQLDRVTALDLVAHFFLFGILTWLSLRAGDRSRARPIFVLLLIATILLVAGLDEWAQRGIANRFASLVDWVADAVGTVVFAGIWLWRFRPAPAGERIGVERRRSSRPPRRTRV
jgi:VanZ family protein